jgi:hypothetical protein
MTRQIQRGLILPGLAETFIRGKYAVVPAPNANGVANALAMPTSGTTTFTVGLTSPAVARNVSAVGNTATVAGNLIVNGTNSDHQAISETLVLNGTTPVVGIKAFATITSAVVPVRGVASDTVSIGLGSKLGLDYPLSHNSILYGVVAGVREATTPVITVGTAGNAGKVEYTTISFTSAFNGTEVQFVYMLTD